MIAKKRFFARINYMIKAIIFDMDGVLVDTEPLWSKGDKEFFKKRGLNIMTSLKQK